MIQPIAQHVCHNAKHLRWLPQSIFAPVFIPAAILIVTIIGATALIPETMGAFLADMQKSLFKHFSWFYILSVGIILFTMLYLAISRFGLIRLGKDDERAQYSYMTWFAMLFSTGMGIGIMFFGIAEPVMHYLHPPVGPGQTIDAARNAMEITFFHWGLHAWAVYACVGLILAYFGFRFRRPLTLRSALYPIFGDRIYGPIGHIADIFAIVGTVFGVATSLGFGVLQLNAGLHYLFDISINRRIQVFLIIAITTIASISVASGLDKGIKLLSQTNLLFAMGLLLLALSVGPTARLLTHFVENIGIYTSHIVEKTFFLYAFEPGSQDWLGGWTLLYWGWWLSWSPFVGLFIARISRGRTIREFIIGVLFVPAGFTLLWMTVFGNSAIDLITSGAAPHLANTIETNVATALFAYFESFPASSLLSILSLTMIVIFFVTSADSGALVVDALSANGQRNTPVGQRLFWSSLMGGCALVLLYANGLRTLQAVTLLTALPFAFILLVSVIGLCKTLRTDDYKRQSQIKGALTPSWSAPNLPWEERLRCIVSYDAPHHVLAFIQETAYEALLSVAKVFQDRGYQVHVHKKETIASLRLTIEEKPDFIFAIQMRRYELPTYRYDRNVSNKDHAIYAQAEIMLREGSREVNVMGWTQRQIIHALLDEYERHITFLEFLEKPERI